MTSNGRPGICTVPSHRPAAFSSAREMNADARSTINATRMRSHLHALCPSRKEVVSSCFLGGYAVTAPRDIDSIFPPLGCAHSIPGKNQSQSIFSPSRGTPVRLGLLSDCTYGERRLPACWFRLLAETDFSASTSRILFADRYCSPFDS
jgi:hypothetical protein